MIKVLLIVLAGIVLTACSPGGDLCYATKPIYLEREAAVVVVELDRSAAEAIDTHNQTWLALCSESE